jgi:hypothetical protein
MELTLSTLALPVLMNKILMFIWTLLKELTSTNGSTLLKLLITVSILFISEIDQEK